MNAGLELRGKNYEMLPLIDWEIGDARWVAQVTDRRVGDLDDDDAEQVIAVLLVSVRHQESTWTDQQVVEFVDSLKISELQQALEALRERAEAEGDVGPPVQEAKAESPSPGSSTESTISPEDTSGVPV